MRLIDADALRPKAYWVKGPDCRRHEIIPASDLDAAPTIACERCAYLDRHWDGTIGRKPTLVCGRAGQPLVGRVTPNFGCVYFKEADHA